MKSWAASLLHGRNHDTQTLPSSFPWRHLCISHFGGGPCSWGIPSSPQSHHTWSLSALVGGGRNNYKKQSGNTSLLCKPAGGLRKQTYVTLIGSAPLEWKMLGEGLPQGTDRSTGMAVGAELSQPEGWLLLLPCTVHGAVLCWSQGWVTFIPSCAWRMTLHPPGSDSGNSEKCRLKVPQNIWDFHM